MSDIREPTVAACCERCSVEGCSNHAALDSDLCYPHGGGVREPELPISQADPTEQCCGYCECERHDRCLDRQAGGKCCCSLLKPERSRSLQEDAFDRIEDGKEAARARMRSEPELAPLSCADPRGCTADGEPSDCRWCREPKLSTGPESQRGAANEDGASSGMPTVVASSAAAPIQSPLPDQTVHFLPEQAAILERLQAERDVLRNGNRQKHDIIECQKQNVLHWRAVADRYRTALEVIAKTKCDQSCDNVAVDAIDEVNNGFA